MEEIVVVVCGSWMYGKSRWMFLVDQKKGCKILSMKDIIMLNDVLQIVCEDYGVDKKRYEASLSYMLPKNMLKKLTRDTPPIFISSERQFEEFFHLWKSNSIRLCVEFYEKEVSESFGDDFSIRESRKRGKWDPSDDEDNDLDDGSEATYKQDQTDEEDGELHRFDYCDDPDGATSDDEDFSLFGRLPEEDEKKPLVYDGGMNMIKQPKDKLDLDSLIIRVGQRYKTKADLETTLKILSVKDQFDFDVDRSATDLYTVNCWVQGCSWRVRASPIGGSSEFYVRIVVGEHSCSITERSARSRQANPEILGMMYNTIGGIGPTVKPVAVAEAMCKHFKIQMEYWKARRVLLAARNLVLGTPEEGYAQLPSYLYMIRKANPGTHTSLVVDDKQRFKYLFISFGASLSGFPYCRKVIVVDGTFLQGKYKGTLLTASTQDGNFQIFPLAFAVVDTENDESWEWFFKQISLVIPDDQGLAIISDRHRSIVNAIGKIYPMATRGICTYHLYKNILVRFKGREAFGLVKKAANAFRLGDFQTIYGQIEMINPELHAYLQRADVTTWTRVHFSGDRYNILTTNIAESLNRVLSGSRSLPIVRLLEEIRLMMTRWFCQRRNDAIATKTHLTRGVEKLLEERVAYAKQLTVQAIDANQFQVSNDYMMNVVNLVEKKCSCRRFDFEKLPCTHAIAAAVKANKSRISLSDPYFKVSYLRKTYRYPIMPRDPNTPIPEKVASQASLPPIVRQPPGRPKNGRIKSTMEKGMESKRPRKQTQCSRCNSTGHNRRTCKANV